MYALEQVLRDSPEHHANIVEVLVEFVRASTRLTASNSPDTTTSGVPAVAVTALPDPADHPGEPHLDIQAALTVLGRLPRQGRPATLLNLAGLHLTGVRLNGANLTRAQFAGTNLSRARLVEADLTRAGLEQADLSDAMLARAHLIAARLAKTNLTHAQLEGADLTRAGLSWADLTDAMLARAHLTAARLARTNLTHAVLEEADLTRAWLGGADLTHAVLEEADLTDTMLPRARMTADQANTASHMDRAVLPAHLVWDPDLSAVRDATAEETAATESQHREQYGWLSDDSAP